MSKLTVGMVREYISDYPQENLLLDEVEFSNTFIELCMDLAVSEYNVIPPISRFEVENFPNKSLLLLGTLWQMFLGKASLKARNALSYSDGGIQVDLDNKYAMYVDLANQFKAQFVEGAQKLKIAQNMEAGWGQVRSDEATFPLW